MSKLLRSPTRLLRRTEDGKWRFARCKDTCCGGKAAFYYLAQRCDYVTPPPIPLPIPETVPTQILIPGPWGCPGEPCEIAGGRLVLYGGYCYVIDIHQTGDPQDAPCDAHLKPKRYLENDLPNPQPPIVDPSQLTCKPLGETCDIDCIPEAPAGSCCTPPGCSGDDQTEPSRQCFACDCPRFNKHALVVQWSGTRTGMAHAGNTNGVFCVLYRATTASGNVTVIQPCNAVGFPFQTAIVSGHTTRTCSTGTFDYQNGDGPVLIDPSCPSFQYSGPVNNSWQSAARWFGSEGWQRAIDEMSVIFFPFNYPGGIGPVVPQFNGNIPCSGTVVLGENEPDAQFVGSYSWAQTANCFGGSYTASGRVRFVGIPGIPACDPWDTFNMNIAWTWVPLVRCDGDPNPLLDVPPEIHERMRKELRKLNRGATRLTFAQVLKTIWEGP